MEKSTLQFLKNLQKNNNKPWFDANRSAYEAARADFAAFIQIVIDKQAKKDTTISHLKAKECMFRINRDVRFAKDKSAYKNNFGASINKGGKKAMNSAGYYFHFEPGNSFVGGGLYQPMPDDLRKIRQEIDYNFAEFKKIIGSAKFKSVYKDLDKSKEFTLSRVPKGYEPDNPAADYLKLKSFITMIPVSDADLTSPELVNKTLEAFRALQPLLVFINNCMAD